jgi:hypothetical protein
MTNVKAALAKRPDLLLSRTRTSFVGKLMAFWQARSLRNRGFFPPMFRKTMGSSDDRLPPHTHGLGVMLGSGKGSSTEARFYPMSVIGSGLEDAWGDRQLEVRVGEDDHVPFARWSDDGARPMQMFSRWYGFSYTFPNCTITE